MEERIETARALSLLFRGAGLRIPDSDLAAIAEPWADLRAKTDMLWFPETRYAEPALYFEATFREGE